MIEVSAALKEPLTGGLNKALTEVLLPGENVYASLTGLSGQGIVLTDKRIIILKAGLSSGAAFGHKARGYYYKDISSIEYSRGLTEGRVQLTVSGSYEQRSGFNTNNGSFLNEVAASRQAETVCQFASNQKKKFQEFASVAQQMIDQAKNEQQAPKSGAMSIPEQIKQLGELLKDGLITQAEFDAQKQALLKQMVS